MTYLEPGTVCLGLPPPPLFRVQLGSGPRLVGPGEI